MVLASRLAPVFSAATMKHSVERSVRRLQELGAPNLLLQLANGIAAPGSLQYELQPPRAFYSAVTDQRFPFNDHIVPLWETNGDSITAFVDVKTPFVIRYYYEDSLEQYEVVGHSIVGAIAAKVESHL